jgi:hypothetical protein
MRRFAAFALFMLALGLTPSASWSRGWLTLEGGGAADYNRQGLQGGGSVDKDEHWLLEGGVGTALSHMANPARDVRANDLSLGAGFFPDQDWDLSLNLNFSTDGNSARSLGGLLGLGLHTDINGFKPGLTMTLGSNNFTADQASGGYTYLVQSQAGLALGFGLTQWLSVGVSGNVYDYTQNPYAATGATPTATAQQPSDSGGFLNFLRPYVPAPRAGQVGQAPGAIRNPILFGFPDRDWSAGLTISAPGDFSVSGDYSQIRQLSDGAWQKYVGASLRQAFNEDLWALKLGWSKAVEGGADSPFFSGSLTWYFRPHGNRDVDGDGDRD